MAHIGIASPHRHNRRRSSLKEASISTAMPFFKIIKEMLLKRHEQHHLRASPTLKSKKIVLVGAGHSGKSALASAYFRPNCGFLSEYQPTVLETHSLTAVTPKDKARTSVEVNVWDTTGVAQYGTLRPLSLHGADAVVVCFAVDCRKEFEAVDQEWVEELDTFCRGVPVILVGQLNK